MVDMAMTHLGYRRGIAASHARRAYHADAVAEVTLQAGEELLCTESHSFLFFHHYHARDMRPRLMLLQDHLPYYEGALFIPDSLRVTPAAIDSAAAHGVSWYAIRAKHAGMDGRDAAALLDRRTAGPALRWEIVSVWTGR